MCLTYDVALVGCKTGLNVAAILGVYYWACVTRRCYRSMKEVALSCSL